MEFAGLLNSAITFIVIMGIFLLFDKITKQNRFKNKGWKFYAGLFGLYMVASYLLYLVR